MQNLSTCAEFGDPSCPGTMRAEPGFTGGTKNSTDHRLISHTGVLINVSS